MCVDQVAASGGYMMAAVADTIVAAPFSMLVSQTNNYTYTISHFSNQNPSSSQYLNFSLSFLT